MIDLANSKRKNDEKITSVTISGQASNENAAKNDDIASLKVILHRTFLQDFFRGILNLLNGEFNNAMNSKYSEKDTTESL